MIQPSRRVQVAGFFAFLLVVDWVLYFRHAAHFFQGDTVFLLQHRAASLFGYLKEFVVLNPSGWYRPLANELIESILYPFAGLHPVAYRVPVYIVFIGVSAGVYTLAFVITRRHLVAGIAAFFFSINTSSAYTTYDLGFMPELQYAIFYIFAIVAFLRYYEDESKTAYRLSLAFFVGSLLSKEAAVTLPGTLFVAGIICGQGSPKFKDRLVHTARLLIPHVVILVLYLAVAVGYLHVQGVMVTKLLDTSQAPMPGDYTPLITTGMFKNADLAFTWAFNIPRAWWGQWQNLSPALISYLKFFRALMLVLILLALLTAERKAILFGVAMFWIALVPALPLVTHFIPYYVFLPMAGLALAVSTGSVWLYDFLSRFRPGLGVLAIVLIFGSLLYVTNRGIRQNIRSNPLLGGSATLASTTLSDLKTLYPMLPADVTLYFADIEDPLAWPHSTGDLIKMAYGTDRLTALYQSQGDFLDTNAHPLTILGLRNRHLIDETAAYRSNLLQLLKYANSDLKLRLSTSEVQAGQGKYTLTIEGLSNTPVRFAYTIDGGRLELFTTRVNADGEVTFDVSPQTRKGAYQFLAFGILGRDEWIRTDQTLIVR
jgi:hypothetical protein